MNIFVTSKDPWECAKNLDSIRVIKMCLETAQILCTVLNEHGVKTPYRSTHKHHPCVKWAGETRANWMWLLEHGRALCAEYTQRYGKVHKCAGIMEGLVDLCHCLEDKPLTPFVNCAANKSLGISYKDVESVTRAYQLYLNNRWNTDKREPKWS